MKKPILAILTQSIRRDNQEPLKYFKKIKVYHFYKNAPYGEMTKDELTGAVQYKSLADLKLKLLKIKPDIIQGAEPYGSKEMFFLSYLAYGVSRQLKIPLIFPCWENRPIKEKFNWLKRIIALWLMKKYIRQASLIFYLNEGARKNLLEAGAKQNRMTRFLWGTWGVDIGLFRPKLKVKSEKLKIKEKTILFGGRLDRAKGLEYLLYAYLKVRRKIKNIKLILIGDGELRDWTEDFVKNHALDKEVTFTGIIKTKDLPKYLHQADVFTCPSITLPWWEEQVGMINLQAQSAGIPVVSTKSGAIPEYVLNGKTGLLVAEKDSVELARALIRILEDDKLRIRLADNARKLARQKYDAQKNIQLAEKIILSIIKNE